MQSWSYDVWGAMLFVPIIITVNLLILAAATAREDDPWVVRVMWAGFAAKLVATVARYLMVHVVYGGVSDSARYSDYAAAAYPDWRRGDVDLSTLDITGTHWLELATTAVYTVVGPSRIAGFVVFASLAYWGTYLFYRAFRIALPSGDRRRYAVLVFLLPSLLFWPASIGKESWLLLFVGLTAYGAARFFSRDATGLAYLAAGAAGTAVVRPHIAALTMSAVVAAQLLRRTEASPTSILAKLGGVATLLGAVAVLAGQSAEFLEMEEVSWNSLSQEIDRRSELATQGGSEFDSTPVRSPAQLPIAALTVLFRPLLWEANSAQMLIQSLEGLLLIGLLVASSRRLRNLPRVLSASPYVTFAVVYVLGFVWAFSGIGNFGILARQRVLMLPAFLVLLALPTRWTAGRTVEDTRPAVALTLGEERDGFHDPEQFRCPSGAGSTPGRPRAEAR